MEIGKVGVIGCGLMGHGITQVCAQAGWDGFRARQEAAHHGPLPAETVRCWTLRPGQLPCSLFTQYSKA